MWREFHRLSIHRNYVIIDLKVYTQSMKLTAGRRFETAVPDEVIITAGL